MKLFIDGVEYIAKTADAPAGKHNVTVDGVAYAPRVAAACVTLVDELRKYRGVKEYTGIVATIQKWYYGMVKQSAWCATCISYFANVCGILPQIGGRNENVYFMMRSCKNARPAQFFDKQNLPATIKKNDILFFLWKGDSMNSGSSKHVTVAEYDSNGDTIFCLGGNQKDKICTLEYERKYLYAVFRPIYEV